MRQVDGLIPGGPRPEGRRDELAAADDLISELVAENEELRERLARWEPAPAGGR